MNLCWLKRLLGLTEEAARPATRLDEAQARAIAAEALGETALVVHEVTSDAGGTFWRIGTATLDVQSSVVVDDATGVVVARTDHAPR